MDRVQLLLVGLPLFLFCSDIINLFTTTRPSPKLSHDQHRLQHRPQPRPSVHTLEFPSQLNEFGSVGAGHSVNIDFCSSCSYRGTAVTMKNMLEMQFPGLHVVLANYPPSSPKRIMAKLLPVVQIGAVVIILAGDQIFPRLGLSPPPWYYTLRANRFGTVSAIWLLGNFLQSSLQSSGAFEVYCDGELVFSKLNEHRFPGEIELRDLVSKRLGSGFIDGSKRSAWA